MALDTWPAGLPLPLREGFAYVPESVVDNTSFGIVDRPTQFASSAPVTVAYHIVINADQVNQFEAFLVTIGRGAKWFLVPVDIGRGVQLYQARIVATDVPRDLAGATWWEIPLDLQIRSKADGSDWNYSLQEAQLIVAYGGQPPFENQNDLYFIG